MAAKITWDISTSIGTIIEPPDGNGVIALNVRTDIWSGAILDWAQNNPTGLDFRKRRFPLYYEGGAINPVTGAQTGPQFFLAAPWKLQMYDAVHELRLTGVLRTSDGSRYWLPPPTAAGYAVIPEVPEDVVAVIPGELPVLVAQSEFNTQLLRNTRVLDQANIAGASWVVLTDDNTGELVKGRAWNDTAGTVPWDGFSPILRVDRME